MRILFLAALVALSGCGSEPEEEPAPPTLPASLSQYDCFYNDTPYAYRCAPEGIWICSGDFDLDGSDEWSCFDSDGNNLGLTD